MIVAIHGGARTAAYFDCPGHPRLSLLRTGAARGFTVIALDRPGYGSSAPYPDAMHRPDQRVALALRRGGQDPRRTSRAAQGCSCVGHSAGCELGAADGRRRTRRRRCSASSWPAPACATADAASEIMKAATAITRAGGAARPAVAARPSCIRPRCSPARLSRRRRPPTKPTVTRTGRARTFPALARARRGAGAVQRRRARAGVASRRSGGAGRDRRAVHRRRRGSSSTNKPDSRTQPQRRSTAADVPPKVLVVRRGMRCRAAGRDQSKWRRVDARRIHRTGQPGRPHGAADRRGRLRDARCGRADRPPSNRIADTAAKIAESPAELAAASDLVCLCVVGDDDVARGAPAVTRRAGRAGAGRRSSRSTARCTPTPAARSPKRLPRQGVSVIDAPVSGGGARRRGGHAAGHGRRRRRRRRALPPGVRDLRRPDRASRPPRQRPGHQDPEQPAVHRQPRAARSSTLELGESLGIPRDRLAEVLNGGSATSKALGSIAVFGGTLDGLAPIAGALLQKDVRHAAEPRRRRVGTRGRGVHAADAALNDRWTTRDDRVGFVGAGRMGAPDGAPPRRGRPRASARSAATDEKRAAIERTRRAAGRADSHDVAEGADVVVVCVFTDEQVRAGLPGRRSASPRCRPAPCSSLHTTGSPRTVAGDRRAAPRRRRRRRAGQRRPARHRRRCRSRCSSAAPTTPSRGSARCWPLRRPDPARRPRSARARR